MTARTRGRLRSRSGTNGPGKMGGRCGTRLVPLTLAARPVYRHKTRVLRGTSTRVERSRYMLVCTGIAFSRGSPWPIPDCPSAATDSFKSTAATTYLYVLHIYIYTHITSGGLQNGFFSQFFSLSAVSQSSIIPKSRHYTVALPPRNSHSFQKETNIYGRVIIIITLAAGRRK